MEPPRKEPRNPLLIEDELWDMRWDNTYPTVRWDPEQRVFRMWYNAFVGGIKPHPSWQSHNPGLKPWKEHMSGLMYATSSDGVRFVKPKLNAVTYPWNGTDATAKGTNLVMMQPGNPDVRWRCFPDFLRAVRLANPESITICRMA